MEARDYQIRVANKGKQLIDKYSIAYLGMEERTGKSIPAIMIGDLIGAKRGLILTKKNALDGWDKTLASFKHNCNFTFTNYHQAGKISGKFDYVVLDESHNYLSSYPKHSKIWFDVAKIVRGAKICYSSATPYAQGPQLLYGQFALTPHSPWAEFRDFYEWYKYYAERDKHGQIQTTRISPTQTVIDYTAVRVNDVIGSVKHLFITYTREELGFEQEPEDSIHFIELGEYTKLAYNTLVKSKVLSFTSSSNSKDYELICDTTTKLRYALHMLEGGTLKVNGDYLMLGNKEKIDYILKTWGDTEDLVIMYQYIEEENKLRKHFKYAKILQGTSNAEGVDLHKQKHLVIYSQDFSTAKHTQRRARQANLNRKDEIKVHFLLVKKAISEQVYTTCSVNKKNFVDSLFEREEL